MLTARTLVLAAASVATVGTIAACIEGNLDLAVVFVVLVALHVGLLYALSGPRRLLTVRLDLARWVEHRAATTGESVDHVLDRCVASYRAGMTADDG
jgi:hypothetical protein